MRHSLLVRIVSAASSLLIISACTATETVTINDSIRVATDSQATTSTRAEEPSSIDTPEPEVVEEVAAPDNDSTNEAPPAATTSPISSGCSYEGVDSFGDMQIELQFTSTLEEQSDATAYYTVNQGADVLVESSRYLEDLAPGEVVRIATDTVTDPPTSDRGITCTVDRVESNGFGSGALRPSPGDTCRFVETDFADDIQVEIAVTNPLAERVDLAVDYVLRGPDGVRFQDGVAYVETLDPGESVAQPQDTLTEFPSWVNEDTFSCEIVAIQGL